MLVKLDWFYSSASVITVTRSRRFRYLRSLAFYSLNAVKKVLEIRGGVMLAMPVTATQTAPDGHARLGSVDDMARIKDTREPERGTTVRRLREGHIFHYLLDQGELCSYCWVSRAGSITEVFFGRRFEVPKTAVYIWDCATFPEHRNRGHYRTVLNAILSTEPGISTAYVAVDQLNRISLRGLESVGFNTCFMYWGIRLLGRYALCIALWDGRLLTLNTALARLARHPVNMDV